MQKTKKKQLIENMNWVTRRERHRFIGEYLSFIKTTTHICLLFVCLLHRRDFIKRKILKAYN
jgi:hypothetical protein